MNDSLEARLLDLFLRGGSRWVLYLLIGLSFVAVAVILERVWFYAREQRPRRKIEEALAALRSGGPPAALAALAGARSMDAAVARAVLRRAAEGTVTDDELVAALELERLRYERGLAYLGTLGNNAPFVGLFGTVLGIIRAFHDLAASTAQGTQAVMAGIAEALVATGVGLLVALPAVATYNAFARHVETCAVTAGALAREIAGRLKGAA